MTKPNQKLTQKKLIDLWDTQILFDEYLIVDNEVFGIKNGRRYKVVPTSLQSMVDNYQEKIYEPSHKRTDS